MSVADPDSARPAKAPVYLPHLTAIRFVFAAWVFGFHAATLFAGSGLVHAPAFSMGYLGVDGFFVLSGLILAHVHGREMATLRGRGVAHFIGLRLARIYPVHAFVLMVYVAYVLVLVGTRQPLPLERYSLAGLVTSLGLVHAWTGYGLTWNIPSWSISAEWAAYLLFPVLAWVSTRLSAWLVLAAGVVLLCTTEFTDGIDQAHFLMRVLPEFVLGMAIARLPELKRPHARVAAGVAAAAALVAAGRHASQLLIVLLLAVVLYALRSTAGGEQVRPAGERRWVLLGEASYSFYLCHFLVLTAVRRAMPQGGDLVVLFAFAATLVAGLLCHRLIETPARVRMRSLLRPIAEPAVHARPVT